MKIFITSCIPEIGISLLQKKYNVKVYNKPGPISRKQLIKEVKHCDGIISLLTDKIDKEVIDSMPNCKVIANYAVGFNNIDVNYAKSKGIIVTNTPDVLTDSTADLAIALALACARRFVEGEQMMRKNKFKGWHPKLLLGMELNNKFFGILGAGRIGSATAIRAASFGCKILYYSNKRNEGLERKTGAKKVMLNTLLKISDIVSIHLPLNIKTNQLLSKDKLELLKPSSILINTARGEIVDEKHLIKMLRSRKIFAAGFDVFDNEPNVNPALLNLKNAVLLPHVGSATNDARNAMSLLTAKNIDAVLSGKTPITPV
ncbi:MAG: D-glycerate dehydrogenase [Ignavibacterium sp.]|nr:D-glycerate dehydrogenase [Ignavibacterium sp.]